MQSKSRPIGDHYPLTHRPHIPFCIFPYQVFEAEWKAYAAECAVTTVLEELHEAADAEAGAEAEAAAPSPAESEAGEAAAPSPAEAEAEAEAGAAVEAEAESEAEAEAEAASKSCFPDINSAEDFSMFLKGELALEVAATVSDAAAARVAMGAAAAVLALAAF
jgi:hypothetical protein